MTTGSLFLKLFGNSDLMQIIDFLIENQVLNLYYSISEIADGLDENSIGVEHDVNILKNVGLISLDNHKVKLNNSNEIVKHLIEIDHLLTRKAADESEKRDIVIK